MRIFAHICVYFAHILAVLPAQIPPCMHKKNIQRWNYHLLAGAKAFFAVKISIYVGISPTEIIFTNLSIYLYVCIYIHTYIHTYLSIYLSINLSINLSIYLSIYLPSYLSIYIYRYRYRYRHRYLYITLEERKRPIVTFQPSTWF